MDIKEFSSQLEALIRERDNLQFIADLYKKQLAVIMINNGGPLNGLSYDDLGKYDWSRVNVSVGNSSCTLTNSTSGDVIRHWEQMPEKNTSHSEL